MSGTTADFWTGETSVFFKSFWGWTPETWGTIGWTGDQGLTHRTNLLQHLSDPFIAVIYVTHSGDGEDIQGKIVGFYLMSHETGPRNRFIHPIHHDLEPEKWVHSLKALRAFSYLPEHRLRPVDLDLDLSVRARAVAKWGEIVTDAATINVLRDTPWVEVDVYQPSGQVMEREEEFTPMRGFNRAGPANTSGYVVSSSAQQLMRQLYVLRLKGNADAYLGKKAEGKRIYKIGVSVSPEFRRQCFQNAMPRGAFTWEIHFSSGKEGLERGFSFEAAVAGEDTMKKHLASSADWLGGEFYLANETDIKTAWKLGCEATHKFQQE